MFEYNIIVYFQGSILMNGTPIQEINTTWLRSFIGVVGQEPVLFATTIAENIRYGNPQVTMDGIQNAAKIANCHDFIQKLPNVCCNYSLIIAP